MLLAYPDRIFPDPHSTDAGSVAVIHPHRGIGDLIWHLPFIRVIADQAPTKRVILVAHQRTFADQLLIAEPCVEEILTLPFSGHWRRRWTEVWRLSRFLRRRSVRTVWILDKISRPAMSAALAGVPNRHGFGLRHQRPWLSDGKCLPKSLATAHQIDKLRSFLELHGLPLPNMAQQLQLPTAVEAAIQDRYRTAPRPWVVLGIGASEAQKLWDPHRYGAVLRGLSARGVGSVFLMAGLGEESLADQVQAAGAPDRGIAVTGLHLAEAAALISASDMFVGNDSGPLNIAAALGVPAIGLFGATPRLSYSPFIHALEPCSHELSRGRTGMAAIDPYHVLRLAETLLAKCGLKSGCPDREITC